MNKNYTRIAIAFILVLTLINGGTLLAQQPETIEPDYDNPVIYFSAAEAQQYDSGVAAYERGHYTCSSI